MSVPDHLKTRINTLVGLGLLLLAYAPGASGSETNFLPASFLQITNLSQLADIGGYLQGALLPVRLEGVVCWTDPNQGLAILQADSRASFLEMDLLTQSVRLGDRLAIEGHCLVQGGRFNLRRAPVVDNDGLHAMTEKAGTVFLSAGKHALDVCWFDKTGECGLEISYQGPNLPRQSLSGSALFHAVVDPVRGVTNWVQGLRCRAFEGTWDRLPDFDQLTPVRQCVVANLDLSATTRTNNVGLQFGGFLEVPHDGLYTFYTRSDDGSRMSLDEHPPVVEVRATNAFPQPRPIIPGQRLSLDECQWSEVEGNATFVNQRTNGYALEVSSAGGCITAILPDSPRVPASLLLHSRLRVRGVCQSTYTAEGQAVAGQLFVPGWEMVEILTLAPQQWAAYPVSPIARILTGPGEEQTGGIVHLLGNIKTITSERLLVLEDATGRIAVETIEPFEEEPEGPVEVLGRLNQAGTNVALVGAVCRETADWTEAGELPLLTTIEQVHGLKREEAQREYPVRVRGVVTYLPSDSSDGVVQDSTRGVYVRSLRQAGPIPPQLGDYLEIQGVTGPGDFAPVISAGRVTRLGRARAPEPMHPTWDQLMNGSVDCQFAELDGILTSVQTNSLRLLLREGHLQVWLEESESRALAPFENAHVRLRGCLLAQWNAETHQVNSGAVQLYAVSVQLEEPAPNNLFAARAKQITELLQFDAHAGAFERVKVSGQILHQRNGEYYLTDGTNGLHFFLKTPTELHLGDEVEVAGFPELGGPSPILREAVARKIGQASLPAPRWLGPETLLGRSNDATLVEMESRLVSLRSNQNDQVLELQSGPRLFVARLSANDGSVRPVPVGSRLRLTGVYAGRGGNRAASQEIDSFELLLNSPADIQVLDRPSWWTTRHTLTVVGALTAVLLLAGAWIGVLRRQVEQRTRELKEEIEQRKQTARELEAKAKLLAAEIEERKRMGMEVERINKELLVASRQAGMAEVATSVLHNVGNVLNSINVSANLVCDQVRRSQSANLSRVAALVQEHAGDLCEFIMHDPKGRHLPAYLQQLAQHVTQERAALLNELQSLTGNIDHVKDIVAMQQSYAKVVGVTETVNPADLVEDALRMNAAGLARHEVELVREYDPHVPAITVDKHKVLQVLVNLVHNAKYACRESGRPDKRLKLRVTNGDDRVRIAVQDNGIGISPENLTRIFRLGFTTRKEGHGFGLHSGALAAKEMGGALLVHSDGPGQGAIFSLELPLQPPTGN